MAAMDCDWSSVAESMRGPAPGDAPIWYQKHMSHHMEGPVSIADFPGHRHAFLIRDPARVAASYAAKRTAIRPEHLGTARQRTYFEAEAEKLGHAPPVIDSTDVLTNPAGVLERLCAALGIACLPVPPAARDDDGYLTTAALANDPTHANAWYGMRLIEQLLALHRPGYTLPAFH